MHDFALSRTDAILDKGHVVCYAPKGSVISAISASRMRYGWLELTCDLSSPKKRERVHNGLMGKWHWPRARINALRDNWSEALWRRWFDIDRIPSDPITQPLKESAFEELWAEIAVAPLVTAMGKEPRGVVNLVDCALRHPDDFRRFAVVQSDDMSRVAAETSNEMVSTDVGGRKYLVPRLRFDWDGDSHLTPQEKADLRDLAKTAHPDRTRPVPAAKFAAVVPT